MPKEISVLVCPAESEADRTLLQELSEDYPVVIAERIYHHENPYCHIVIQNERIAETVKEALRKSHIWFSILTQRERTPQPRLRLKIKMTRTPEYFDFGEIPASMRRYQKVPPPAPPDELTKAGKVMLFVHYCAQEIIVVLKQNGMEIDFLSGCCRGPYPKLPGTAE